MRARDAIKAGFADAGILNPFEPTADRDVDDVIAALRDAGYELCPTNPTDKMLSAGADALFEETHYRQRAQTGVWGAGIVYSAMISAAKEQT